MKPVTLSMTAFGPYKDKEVIDFELLDGHDLFVISGATGAGKTTIFDAICFALYGTASGSDRENMTMLRSHFAADDVHTAVEFSFKLHDRVYRVLRQLGHVKKGNKSRTGEKYEFYEVLENGEEIPRVDRQNVSEINRKIEQLIGLSEDQFKQIVMLPQGEFRKLLTSETENKEDILRRIFKTERYLEMRDILQDKKAHLAEQFESKQQMLDHQVQSITTLLEKRDNSLLFEVLEQEHFNTDQVLLGLEEEIAYLQGKIEASEKAYAQAIEQFEQRQKHFYEAKAINEKFTELDEKGKESDKLQGDKVLFLQKENKLQAAERALTIEPYEKQVTDRREELLTKQRAVELMKQAVDNAQTMFTQTQNAYREEENKTDKREKLKRDMDRFTEILPIVKELNEKKETIGQLAATIQEKRTKQSELVKEIDTNAEKIAAVKTKITEKEKALLAHGEKKAAHIELQHQYKIFHQYNQLKRNVNNLEKELTEKEKTFKRIQKSYQAYESVWLTNQAVILASQLHEGDACPVCGSTHHPQKRLTADGVSRVELDHRKAKLEQAEKAYRDILNDYNNTSNQLNIQAQEVANYDVALEHVIQETENVIKRGKEVKQELDNLKETAKQVEQFRNDVQTLEEKEKTARANKENIDQQLQTKQTEHTALHATVQEQTRNIPDEIQDLQVLQEKLKATEAESALLEQQWKDVQKQLELAKETSTKAHVELMSSEKQVDEVALILKNLEASFKKKITEANFDDEAHYLRAKLPELARENLTTEIELYKQQVVTVRKRIEELTTELTEKKREDLTKLEEALQHLKQLNNKALEQLNQDKKYDEAATHLRHNIIEVRESSHKIEKELAVVNDLYDVIRGQNVKKISFERYLQIDYLEQITSAANERFKLLTNGQFQLIRSDRQEAYGKQSGLAIDVHDAYTGQTRDVKTLSGGEKFIASLCLALGMSDVIQSFQGSISIETMFIDEGFGSLDEESLHKSIDALVNLQQSGRMIGVISHVEELKMMFPASLEVKKTKEGYSKAEIVIK